MNRLRWLGLLQAGFIFWVLIGAGWGYVWSAQASSGAGWISEALMLIMLGMGLTLKSGDVASLRHAGRPLLLGLVLQYLIMPLAAWTLAYGLDLPPMLALGIILVGACPGGTASNVVTWLARGDVPLSIAMTTASTLLAPLLTPLWVWLLASTWLDVDPAALLGSVVKIVLLPVLLGILIRRYWQPTDWVLEGVLPLAAMLVIAWIVGVIVGLNVDRMTEIALASVAAVVLLNAVGLLLGRGLSHLAGTSKQRSRTVAIEVGMQNSGLAVALAMVHFSPEAAVAGAMFSLWHNLSGAALAAYWRRSAV